HFVKTYQALQNEYKSLKDLYLKEETEHNNQKSEFMKVYQALQNEHNILKDLYHKEEKDWKNERKVYQEAILNFQLRTNEENKKLTIELNKKDLLYQTHRQNWENERLKNKEIIEDLQNKVISLKTESAQLESKYKKLTIELDKKDTLYQTDYQNWESE
ncbi:12837_t:CDS:1, partial [Ambispora leptoticha]